MLALGACLSQNPLEPTHYFAPNVPATGTGTAQGQAKALSVGRVRAVAHLSERRMVYRVSDVEMRFDDNNLWSAQPAEFVEDALAQALFVESGFARSNSPDSPQLDVRVVAFEELLEPSPTVVLELWVYLQPTSGAALIEHSVRVTRAPEDSSPAALARTMGQVLAEATASLATWVAGQLP